MFSKIFELIQETRIVTQSTFNNLVQYSKVMGKTAVLSNIGQSIWISGYITNLINLLRYKFIANQLNLSSTYSCWIIICKNLSILSINNGLHLSISINGSSSILISNVFKLDISLLYNSDFF